MKSIIETAKNIIATYEYKGEEYAAMVANARRILREEAEKAGVVVENLGFSKVNEAGNRVDVPYAVRTAEQKKIAKLHGATWKSLTDRYDAQTRCVVLSRWAGK